MEIKVSIKKAVNECASFSCGDCIFDNPCYPLEGKRCGWFEEAVLAAPEQSKARLDYAGMPFKRP